MFVLVLFSCKNDAKVEKEDQENKEIENVEHEHKAEPITLNEGKKWTVVPEMMNYIRKTEKTLAEFEHADRKDYVQLANDISEQLSELTSHCTMTGKAHDELHKWLVPFLELSDQLDQTEKTEEQKKIVKEMSSSFKTFNTYFE